MFILWYGGSRCRWWCGKGIYCTCSLCCFQRRSGCGCKVSLTCSWRRCRSKRCCSFCICRSKICRRGSSSWRNSICLWWSLSNICSVRRNSYRIYVSRFNLGTRTCACAHWSIIFNATWSERSTYISCWYSLHLRISTL